MCRYVSITDKMRQNKYWFQNGKRAESVTLPSSLRKCGWWEVLSYLDNSKTVDFLVIKYCGLTFIATGTLSRGRHCNSSQTSTSKRTIPITNTTQMITIISIAFSFIVNLLFKRTWYFQNCERPHRTGRGSSMGARATSFREVKRPSISNVLAKAGIVPHMKIDGKTI